MEDLHILNVDNIHMFCLHYIFLPKINHAIGQFLEAWNNHLLSTMSNSSPIQLWISGLSRASVNDEMTKANSIHNMAKKIIGGPESTTKTCKNHVLNENEIMNQC